MASRTRRTPDHPPVRAGTVYFLWGEGTHSFKIGFTSQTVGTRAAALEACSAVPLRILATRPGSFADEAYLHSQLSEYRSHAEWFALPEDYGEDSDFVRVRVRGVFPRAGSMQFIPGDIVDAAAVREPHVELHDPLVLGVDVARFGDDQSVIYIRKGRDGRTFPPIKLRGVDTMTLAGRVADLHHQHQADGLFVDGGGVGAGVVDRLLQLGLPVFDVQFGGKADRATMGQESGLYANKRAEMWGNMRDWLPGGAIPDDAELKADLTGTEYGYNKDSAIQLERKEDMKKRGLASPDVADALALTFAYSVAPRRHAPGPGWPAPGPRVVTDYNPWRELDAETNVVTDWDPHRVE